MEAKNFHFGELAGLVRLAHEHHVRVYVALNTLLKPAELTEVRRLLALLQRWIHPDALIVQDPGIFQLAKEAGFRGDLHLSTLANVSFPSAFPVLQRLPGLHRVVIPRELDVDEIKQMAQRCPPGLDLEVFVHGALCYGVSGRCYWSSFLGGKSGLRGRCVQPCRRRYRQQDAIGRFFSCSDFSLDVLAKVLLDIPQIRAWKIEGRKKGPHYVYHTVQAYRLLRDHHTDSGCRKEALYLLETALGRYGTHYRFLPQRPQNPIQESRQTGSGFLIGRVSGAPHNPSIRISRDVFADDMLRIGYEDDPFHMMKRMTRDMPADSRIPLPCPRGACPPNGAAVFLTDRREKTMMEEIGRLAAEIRPVEEFPSIEPTGRPEPLWKKSPRKGRAASIREQWVSRGPGSGKPGTGIWLDPETDRGLERRLPRDSWIWLSPVVWPGSDRTHTEAADRMVRAGFRNFVLNAPWQIGWFAQTKSLNLWAGPFCNIANPAAIHVMADMGFSGVIISPELGGKDTLGLPVDSVLPLGLVVSGFWPLCISRISADSIQPEIPIQSPKKEISWVRRYGDSFWVYPDWEIDLKKNEEQLKQAGYRIFVHLVEKLPDGMSGNKRPGKWNWNLDLM